jgi:hypothetical protein
LPASIGSLFSWAFSLQDGGRLRAFRSRGAFYTRIKLLSRGEFVGKRGSGFLGGLFGNSGDFGEQWRSCGETSPNTALEKKVLPFEASVDLTVDQVIRHSRTAQIQSLKK